MLVPHYDLKLLSPDLVWLWPLLVVLPTLKAISKLALGSLT